MRTVDSRIRRARVPALVSLGIVLLVGPSVASAYSLRRLDDGRPVRWGTDRVELRVDPSIAADPSQAIEVARAAASAWDLAPSGPVLLVEGDTASAPGYRGDGRDENGIYRVRDWPYGQALAVTVTSCRAGDGEIVDADVLVSTHAELAVGGDHLFDLQAVLTHELGHVLGLGESSVDGATMWPSIARGDLGARTIDVDDEDGLAELYPASSVTAAGGCAVRGHGAAPGLAMIGVLAIAAALAVRRRAIPLGASIALCALATASIASAPSDRRARELAEVIDVEVEDRGGLFVTRARVVTASGAEQIVEVPGGTIGGIEQHVHGFDPVRPGDRIVIADRARGAKWRTARVRT